MATRDNPLIIGLTGSFGSGCSYIARNILENRGYCRIVLSELLGEEFKSDTNTDGGFGDLDRRRKQEYGDEIRRKHGSQYLAEKAVERINSQSDKPWVVDSIRNPGEIKLLRDYSNRFFLFGISADEEVRWGRTKDVFGRDRGEFEKLDTNDKGNDSEEHGQRVAHCFDEADVVLANDTHIETTGNEDFENLKGKVGRYVDLIEHPLTKTQPLNKHEALMAMAYAASQRSSCLKRKVGAVLADDLGNVISSGYNEVPKHEKTCAQRYTKCHRDHIYDEFFKELKNEVPETAAKETILRKRFRSRFKLLDYCRALHAEENVIVTLARNGNIIPLERCTLYTTTYPCRMCANKIHNVGIKRVVYLEPYPQQEAKIILRQAKVTDEFFQGVTYRAFFRLYGEQR